MTKNENDSESLLLECIDRIMPIALQIALEKNLEPTYKNVLHVIATHGHEWFLTLTATGNFVQLSAGWMFVRQTKTVITDNSAMDDAVLHSLRNLSSFGKGVELADLCSYISAAFKFPKALSPGEISDKVQCSANSMKAWGRVEIDTGRYKLPAEVLTADSRGTGEAAVAKVEPSRPAISNSSSPSSTLSVDVKREPEIEPHVLLPTSSKPKMHNVVARKDIPDPEITPGKRVYRSAKGNSAENTTEKFDAVLESDQVSITSANSPLPNTSVERARSTVRNPRELDRSEPFLYANGRYKVFIAYDPRTNKKPNLGSAGNVVRTLLQHHDLSYCSVFVPPTRPSIAFVEIGDIAEGMQLMEKLHDSLQENGAFRLRVEWALPTERDLVDVQYAKWQKQQQRPSRSPTKLADPRSQPRTPDRSTSLRTKRRRSRTRSPRRPSRVATPVNVDRRRGQSTSSGRPRTKCFRTPSPSSGEDYHHYSPSPLKSARGYADRTDARGHRGGSSGRYSNDVPPIDRPAYEGGTSYRVGWPEDTLKHSDRISEPYRSPERRNNWDSRQYSQTEYRTNEKARYNKSYR